MHDATIRKLAQTGEERLALWQRDRTAFVVSSMLAGAYVGIGIVLIFVLGSGVPPEWRKLVMAASFGIALVLVVMAGADLFTGHHLYGVLARLTQRVPRSTLAAQWAACWAGNLAGALLLAALVTIGGGAGLHDASNGLLQQVAAHKMQSPAHELFARAVLCNWLVCLALWMATRCSSEAARGIVIWWCLFAFIAAGFEHSVANMTLMALALMGPHDGALSAQGMAHNLLWVSAGNVLGGSVFVALAYWRISRLSRLPAISDGHDLAIDAEVHHVDPGAGGHAQRVGDRQA